MGNKEQNKQKKLAKKRAKAKAKKKSAMQVNSNYANVYKCVINDGMEAGMASILIAKQTGENSLRVAGFVLDLYCLGIKNSFLAKWSIGDFEEAIARQDYTPYLPAKAKKLVLDSEKYARKVGFEPHKDYAKALSLFKDVDIDENQEFSFGQNGEPMLIQGPNDSEEKIKEIVSVLNQRLWEK